MKKNPLLWVFGGFLLLVLGKFFFGEKASTTTQEATTPAAAPVTSTEGLPNIAAKSEIGQLFSTLDWNVTTPGKAVAELLGSAGWANWVLWGAVVFLIIMLVQAFYKPKGAISLGPAFLKFVGFGLVAVAFYATLTTFMSRQDTTYAEVDFRHGNAGTVQDVRMGFSTIALLKLRAANLQKDGDVYFWGCPKVVWPAKLPFEPKFQVVAGAYTNQVHIALTPESKQALMENGTNAVDVRFTFTVSRALPCQHLKYERSS